MKKEADVSTTSYIPGIWEKDEDGCYRVDDDFSCTDWPDEYRIQHRTPLQLINLLRDISQAFITGKVPDISIREWKSIEAECKGWEIEDEETIQL